MITYPSRRALSSTLFIASLGQLDPALARDAADQAQRGMERLIAVEHDPSFSTTSAPTRRRP